MSEGARHTIHVLVCINGIRAQWFDAILHDCLAVWLYPPPLSLYNALYRVYRVYRGEMLRYLDAMRVLYVLVHVHYRYIRCRACSIAPLPVTDSSVWTVVNRVSDWPDQGIS